MQPRRPTMIIETPNPFAPRKVWVAFLEEMRAAQRENPQSEDIADAIKTAEDALNGIGVFRADT